MKHKRPPIPVIILVVLVVLLTAYFTINEIANREDGTLTASGTIEAVSITISPETGGKVLEVLVDEGDKVTAGEVLFRLDDTLLQAQRAVASSNLDLAVAARDTASAARNTAQANFDLAAASAYTEFSTSRTLDWNNPFTGTITQAEELMAALGELDAATVARDQAQDMLSNLISNPASNEFVVAETRLLKAQAAYTVAQQVLQRANLSIGSEIRETAQTAYDEAGDELDSAQAEYDALVDTDSGQAILDARSVLAVSQERIYAAQDRLLVLQTGEYSLRLSVATASLRQAEAALSQAEFAIAQVQASLDLIDVQISRLTVTSPMAGIIQTLAIQPGEVIPAGASALKLARLDDLSITVFVPEDRYGELSLGQSASVMVDSFPDRLLQCRNFLYL